MRLVKHIGTVALCTLIALAAVPAAAHTTTADEPTGPLLWLELEVGDVVAVGSPTDGACAFEDIQVRMDQPTTAGVGTFVDLRIADDCTLTVAETGYSTTSTTVLKDEYHTRSDEPNSTTSSGVSTMVATKTVTTEVIHYGTGGTDDVLTVKDQTIEWSYDGSTATMQSDSGQCKWKSGWKNDACLVENEVTSGSYVYRESRGEYHYDPFNVGDDLYHHNLTALTWGHADGGHTCDYGVTGEIVYGAYMNCIVG